MVVSRKWWLLTRAHNSKGKLCIGSLFMSIAECHLESLEQEKSDVYRFASKELVDDSDGSSHITIKFAAFSGNTVGACS